MLRPQPRIPVRVRPRQLAPAVVAIVLGILGMHGLDAHGVNMRGTMTHAEAATPTVTAVHDPGTVGRGDAHSTPHLETSATSHNGGDAGGMGGMVMLCVAMLAGAAGALLALFVRRGRLPTVWAVLQPAQRLWRPKACALRAGAGPPNVWRFSVIRC